VLLAGNVSWHIQLFAMCYVSTMFTPCHTENNKTCWCKLFNWYIVKVKWAIQGVF